MRTLKLVLACCAIGALSSARSQASIVTYTDRPTFNAAAGPIALEDFNSFVSEVPFHTVSLDVGDFTISMTNSPSTAADRNKIDVPALDFPEMNVDGTAVMNVLTFLPQSMFLTFDQPITAFGADFTAFNNDFQRTILVVNGEEITPPMQAGNTLQFFGFVSSSPFSVIEFRATDDLFGDGYGIDNAAYSSAVPEPSSLLGIALTAGLFLIRRQSTTTGGRRR